MKLDENTIEKIVSAILRDFMKGSTVSDNPVLNLELLRTQLRGLDLIFKKGDPSQSVLVSYEKNKLL